MQDFTTKPIAASGDSTRPEATSSTDSLSGVTAEAGDNRPAGAFLPTTLEQLRDASEADAESWPFWPLFEDLLNRLAVVRERNRELENLIASHQARLAEASATVTALVERLAELRP